MKILVGMHEDENLLQNYIDSFVSSGHKVTLLTTPDKSEKDQEERYCTIVYFESGSMKKVEKLIFDHDLFFFFNGSSLLPNNADYHILKKAKKSIISILTDSNEEKMSSSQNEYLINNGNLKLLKKTRMLEKYSDLIFSRPSYSKLALRPYYYSPDYIDKDFTEKIIELLEKPQNSDCYPDLFTTKYKLESKFQIPSFIKVLSTEIIQSYGLFGNSTFDKLLSDGLISWENAYVNKDQKIDSTGVKTQIKIKDDDCLELYFSVISLVPLSCYKRHKDSTGRFWELLDDGTNNIKDGNIGIALEYFQEANKKDPKSVLPLWAIANIMFGNGHYDKALDIYEQIVKKDPKSGIAYYYIGVIYSISNRLEQALEFISKAIDLLPRTDKEEIVWGPVPILNNKYWSEAMNEYGYRSKTIMHDYYANINKRTDYDLYYDDLCPMWLNLDYRKIGPYFNFLYQILNARAVVISFYGGSLRETNLENYEASLLKKGGIKIVISTFGGDYYRYSQIKDLSMRHALLLSYPEMAKKEVEISQKINYWIKNVDIVTGGFILADGLARWDCLPFSRIAVDTIKWSSKLEYSMNDGRNGAVKIIHSPNRKGVKGSEFLEAAVKQLQDEGLKVELILLQGVQNDKVCEFMKKADILAEQFIMIGYGLSGVEGLASGLVVLSNLDNEVYTRIFRRYGYLDECPIVSTTPENIADNLRILVTNPQLRKELGQASRKYAEKYHSYKTAKYFWGSIFRKILDGVDVDLMHLFHPLKSDYNRSMPIVSHPLFENKIPESYSPITIKE